MNPYKKKKLKIRKSKEYKNLQKSILKAIVIKLINTQVCSNQELK
jgi:hypothetical protein